MPRSFKRTSVDVSASVKSFHDRPFAGSVRTDVAGSGGFEHDVESGGSERNDRRAAGGEMREYFGFFRRHTFERTEVFEVTASDGDDQRRIGADGIGERFDFPVVVCSAFDDAEFVFGSQFQQILRNADLIVGVAFGREHMFRSGRAGENGAEHLFCTGLSA